MRRGGEWSAAARDRFARFAVATAAYSKCLLFAQSGRDAEAGDRFRNA
jgi:hypothetical protein